MFLIEIIKENLTFYTNFSLANIFFLATFVIISFFTVVNDIKKHEVNPIILICSSVIMLVINFFLDKQIFILSLFSSISFSMIFLTIYFISKEGIGLGDMLYFAFYSSIYGPLFSVITFFLSFWLATIILLPFLISKKVNKKTKIAFTPFIFISGLISILLIKNFLLCFVK